MRRSGNPTCVAGNDRRVFLLRRVRRVGKAKSVGGQSEACPGSMVPRGHRAFRAFAHPTRQFRVSPQGCSPECSPCKSPVFRLFYQGKTGAIACRFAAAPCFFCLFSPDAASFYRGACPLARPEERGEAARLDVSAAARRAKAKGRAAGERRACRFVVVYNESALATDPHSSFAVSRSLNFWILPVEVLGKSANTTKRGHL